MRLSLSASGMTAKMRPSVLPGEQAALTIEWDTAGVNGAVEGKAVVEVNDPGRPQITFVLGGVVKQAIEFLPYQAFAYGAGDLRSPFDPPIEVKPIDPARKNPDVKPNFDRVKQYLEQFDMTQLAMVGTLAQGSRMYALMRDARGGVHRVQTGDYMGTDHGKIVAIDEGSIEMLEIVSDGAGGWVERERTVSLGGAES